jgi:hypothetical protein
MFLFKKNFYLREFSRKRTDVSFCQNVFIQKRLTLKRIGREENGRFVGTVQSITEEVLLELKKKLIPAIKNYLKTRHLKNYLTFIMLYVTDGSALLQKINVSNIRWADVINQYTLSWIVLEPKTLIFEVKIMKLSKVYCINFHCVCI